jgi:hypothetical protein
MSPSHDLVARFMMLGPDHRDVFELLLDKAEGGAKKYGVLELANDSRDFEAEARAELLDCIHYLGAECVKRGRVVAEHAEQLRLARAEIETLRNRLSVAQRLVPRTVTR